MHPIYIHPHPWYFPAVSHNACCGKSRSYLFVNAGSKPALEDAHIYYVMEGESGARWSTFCWWTPDLEKVKFPRNRPWLLASVPLFEDKHPLLDADLFIMINPHRSDSTISRNLRSNTNILGCFQEISNQMPHFFRWFSPFAWRCTHKMLSTSSTPRLSVVQPARFKTWFVDG